MNNLVLTNDTANMFKIKSELSEKQIEADVSNYLGWITPANKLPIRLIDVNESITGADKKVDLVIPLYLQFKVSHGLKQLTSLQVSFKNSDLQKIRKFRRREELEDNPTLYFKLRDIANHAEDFQHNILMKLNQLDGFRSYYVAPLFLTRDEYNKAIFDLTHRWDFPFRYRHIEILEEGWFSLLGALPFLRAHISIPPHVNVTHSNHYYSFSSTGSDIAWHSPSILHGVYRLSDTFENIFKNAFSSTNMWQNITNAFDDVTELIQVANSEGLLSSENKAPIENFQVFGRNLYSKYGIRQFLLCTTKENLLEYLNGK